MFDQYLNFVTLEPQLFCLNHSNSYVAYNSSQVADEVVGAIVYCCIVYWCGRLKIRWLALCRDCFQWSRHLV